MNGKEVGILLLLVFLVIQSPPLQSADSSLPFISEIDPYSEGFSLSCSRNFDLTGYYVTDGEGTLKFTNGPTIPQMGRLTFVKAIDNSWFCSRDNVIVYGERNTEKKGAITLADQGDELELCKSSGITVDSVCYGTSKGVTEWEGSPVMIKTKTYLLRATDIDTNTSADWIYTKPGWTSYDYSDEGFESWVSPFVFPDSEGIPVIKTLESAKTKIDISIYLLSSKNIAALLQEKALSGVNVRILIEGNPLGVDIASELSNLGAVKDAGGEIRIINYSDHTRYSYVHNKYAIVDDETVIITSENWTAGNIGKNGNRGWGAAIESETYAQYMKNVFENDFEMTYGDVIELEKAYPNLKSADLKYYSPGPYYIPTFKASVIPILSPDNSFDATKNLILNQTSRIYAEQMDLGQNLSQIYGDTPIAWMSSMADKGVDAKFILDSSQSNGQNHEAYVNAINTTTNIDAICVNGNENYSLIHNKGIIQDDKVWVGSVNWTSNSFENNRETAVIINSKEVSDYFAGYFLEDFGISESIDGGGLHFNVRIIEAGGKIIVSMSVTGPANQTYVWELGNGVVRTTATQSVIFDAPSIGNYVAKVTLLGTDVSESFDYQIGHPSNHQSMLYVITLIVPILGLAIALIRMKKNVVKTNHPGNRNPPNAFRGFR